MSIKGKVILAALSTVSLVLAAACGSSAGAGGQSGGDLSGEKIVFVNYGGDTLTAAQKAWLDPFAKNTGAQTATDSPSDPAKIKAMVQAGNPTWDVVWLDTGSGAQGCGTLYEKRSDFGVSVKDVDPRYVSDQCGVPVSVENVALVYNTKKFGGNPPAKITDFMDTQKYPGQRLMYNYASGGLESLLLASGVAPDQLYPLDLQRAAATVKTLGRNLTLDATLAQETQELEAGDFAMCLCYLGRAAIAAQNGAPVGVTWNHSFAAWAALYAVKGSRSPKAQAALLNYIATPPAQAAFTENIPYGPTTPASKPNVPASFHQWLPQENVSKMDGEALSDSTWWAQNADKAFAAWTAMTSG
ncbi:extracellular solute-binding protein [Amycolatopsis sp. Poz14]|uniref:extracellular solute-binding protein n=1 Tax=Amycolatopsis sp. Poz14 TaxID=1447705 RepID=UPI001EE9460B|nr:extracellular solute-binding protein [Amycolatopsis sp. Poz14]MCG3752628.1 extracellular solute-binding protein [Amycolatopsis sp. Poz14]